MLFSKELNAIIVMIMFPVVGFAQSAIVAGGGSVFTQEGSVSSSIGQVDYLTVSSAQAGVVAAGVQQAYVQVKEESTTGSWTTRQVKLMVYPNPTQDRCRLTIENSSAQFQYVITDLAGKTHAEGKGSDGSWISFDGLMNGTYLLKLYQKENIVTTFKIIKE